MNSAVTHLPLKLAHHLGEILEPPLAIYPVNFRVSCLKWSSVMDLHSKILDAHPSGPIFFFIFMRFSTNFVQIIG